jgi:hypothetical protein
MSDPASSAAPVRKSDSTREELKNGITGEAGVSHDITLTDVIPIERPANYPTWTTRIGELPPDWIQWVIQCRGQVADHPKLGSKYNGFAYAGLYVSSPTVLLTEKEKEHPRLEGVLKALQHEVGGEGGCSSVMTGDGAKFTWGHGMTGGIMYNALDVFIKSSEEIKTALSDCGIFCDAKGFKIIDVEKKMWVEGAKALDFLNGSSPAPLKKNLLSIIATVGDAHLQAAEDAQWAALKQWYYTTGHTPPPDVVDTWEPETICWVLHCLYWGKAAKWEHYKKTGGNLAKLLRMEADATYPHKENGHVLIKSDDKTGSGQEIFPATTILFNFGHGLMVKKGVVLPLDDKETIQNGDVVFEIHPAWRKMTDKKPYAVLPNTPQQFNAQDDVDAKYAQWLADNQGKDLDHIWKECTKKGYDFIRKTRDWYSWQDSPNHAPREALYGLRIRAALDTFLHKGDSNAYGWILNDLKVAEITPETNPDQINAVKKMLNVA